MARNIGRNMIFAGMIGAIAGVYLMNRFEGTSTERKLKYRGRALARGARHNASKIGSAYQAGREAISQSMDALRR